jgi:hypothetical protein
MNITQQTWGGEKGLTVIVEADVDLQCMSGISQQRVARLACKSCRELHVHAVCVNCYISCHPIKR